MQNNEPPITQDPAGQATAQQRALARALWARHKLAIAASATGASFVSHSRAGASMAMAVLTGVALLCYLGNLFAAPPGPTATSQGGRG